MFLALASAAAVVGCAGRGGDRNGAAAAAEVPRDDVPVHAPSAPPPQGSVAIEAAGGSEDHPRLAEQVRELAKPHCGECHQSARPTAKPAALAVFDLDRVDWYVTMADDQLESFRRRSEGKMDRDVVGAFLRTEKARRATAPSEVKGR
jgi:mono/diheme cytochrome c family protein